MKDAQQWLDENYLKEERKKVRILLIIFDEQLEGHLDLQDFINLELLEFWESGIISLDISQCSKLTKLFCPKNLFDLCTYQLEENLKVKFRQEFRSGGGRAATAPNEEIDKWFDKFSFERNCYLKNPLMVQPYFRLFSVEKSYLLLWYLQLLPLETEVIFYQSEQTGKTINVLWNGFRLEDLPEILVDQWEQPTIQNVGELKKILEERKKYTYSNKQEKNLENIMVSNNKWDKVIILQWEGIELRDEEVEEINDELFTILGSSNNFCENFAVIFGSDEEFLLFKPDFFAGTEYKNSFKKGKIYRFCFSGEFKKNSGNVIESVEEGGFEVNELSEVVPFIRGLYKEKEKSVERKNLAEKELEEKRNIIKEMNEERSGVKGELSDLEGKFSRLQFEKTKIETEWTTPEKCKELLEVQQELEEKLATVKEENRKLSGQLEKISKQDWNTTLAEKIQSKKTELEKLKDKVRNKLDNNMLKSSLEVYLTANEQLVLLRMEKVNERVCVPTKKQLERSRENLRKKVNSEELQNIRQIHSEIVKMEVQQKQWEEWKEQQTEAYVEVPINID